MIRTELLAAVPTLRSPRLLLRPMGPQYLPQVRRVLADPELARLTGTHTAFTEQQVREHLERIGPDRSRADWAILRKEDGSFLGEVVLNELDEPNASMNFRISLRETKICGQGYGTEAGRSVINFGLGVLGLHRIGLEVYAFNSRAMASYRKLGFQPEGVRREALHWDGRWHDAHLMAVIAGDLAPESAAVAAAGPAPGPGAGATDPPATERPAAGGREDDQPADDQPVSDQSEGVIR